MALRLGPPHSLPVASVSIAHVHYECFLGTGLPCIAAWCLKSHSMEILVAGIFTPVSVQTPLSIEPARLRLSELQQTQE